MRRSLSQPPIETRMQRAQGCRTRKPMPDSPSLASRHGARRRTPRGLYGTAFGATRKFCTFRRPFLPVFAHVARFSNGRIYGVTFLPPLTCGAGGCDIRPMGIWHLKTVQHTLLLANSDSEMYEVARGWIRGAAHAFFGIASPRGSRPAEPNPQTWISRPRALKPRAYRPAADNALKLHIRG